MTACQIYPVELPNWVRRDPRRSAEVRLYDLLRFQLGQGWVVFYSVAWLVPTHGAVPQDGETDFIVSHPDKGILLIEVKGGRIRFDGQRRQWISKDRDGVDHDIDPFQQVRQSKYALLNKLKSLRALKSRWIELFHAVAFVNVERPRHAVTPDAPPEIIIGADDLARLPDRIEEILAYSRTDSNRGSEHGAILVAELVRLLAQTTELRNPLALQASEEEREIVRLTEEQFRLLDNLSRIRRAAIGGCAGAGKTFLAVEKAKRLAREEFRTLLTCFNRPLADHLAMVTAGTANLEVETFHALCARLAEEAGLKLPVVGTAGNERIFREDYPAALCEALQRCPDKRYDAILVDEGQDFEDTWWIALEDCLQAGKESIFYVFYDNHQALYRGRGSLPADLVEISLTENIRNTRAIYQILVRHYEGEKLPRPRGPTGRTVETHVYTSDRELGQLLSKVLHRLLVAEGFSNQDVVVLTPKALERSALPTLRLSGSLRLVTDEPPTRSSQVRYSTIHRFKGLERRVVIVAELDGFLPTDAVTRSALCYVAFSRPRTHLVLLGTAEVLPSLLPEPF